MSGMAAELEEARALGELRRRGWAPKRTIVYIAWDGEEQGLLGSTEHVEARAEQLQRHAVVYINTDSNSRGFLGMGGSHALEGFINDVARDVMDPEAGVSVWKRAQARRIVSGTPAERTGRTDSRAAPHRRARVGIRLHAVPAARRHRQPEHRVWRRGRGGHLPLGVRQLPSLLAVPGPRLRLRTRAGANRGHRRDPAGRRGPPAV